jgi:hypothetical protein
MKDNSFDNPFYDNHIFTSFDRKRYKIKWWQYPILWFRPTYIQINDGYVFKYKTTADGRIFLLRCEKI